MIIKYNKLLLSGVIALVAIMFLFPLVLTISNSFMTEREIAENYKPISADRSTEEYSTDKGRDFINLKLIPDEVVIKQYYKVLLHKPRFLIMFWNSMALVMPIVIGQILVASMAAYAFAKIKFRWREQIFFIYIITMMMPFQVTLVPNYIVADKLGILGSYLSIIFPGVFGTFGVFLLRQFMMYIPDDYAEASRVDGAGHFEIFFRIILPMTKTGIAALGILSFIDNWNMVDQPVIFLSDESMYPLSIFLSSISNHETGIAFAASTIYMFPMLLMFLFGENYLIQGIQLSGIKG